MFQIGTFEVHVISGGLVYVDGGGAFGLVPRALWSRYQTPNDAHHIPMCLNCLLVKAHGKHILVDTGMGFKMPPKMVEQWHLSHPHGTLLDGLARLGLQASDIDLVINTHLHGDHCEGNTSFDAEGNLVPTFPNAEHVVQRREYQDASNPNERTRATYINFNFEPLVASGQMRLLDGDEEFLSGIRGVVTPGHTPGHMSVIIEDGGQSLFFTCDLATYSIQFEKLGWMTAYDVEPLVTLESKRRWQGWALEHDPIIVFPHDTVVMAARFRADEKGQGRLVPLTSEDGACYS